jgi:hypothetical protein
LLPSEPARPAHRSAHPSDPTPDPLRRDVLRGGAIAGAAGLTSLVLPAAAAHASPSIGLEGDGATTAGFDDGFVSAMARHDVGGVDGLVLSGTYSPDADGFPSRLTRIVPTDVFDPAFDTKTSALMAGQRALSIAVQPDGAIVAVGTRSGSPPPAALVVRVAADGTPDTAFNSNVPTIAGGGFNQAWDVLVRTDGLNVGKILIAGDFTTATPPGSSALDRVALLQLNADGTLDTGFAPNWTRTGYVAGALGAPVGRTLLVLPDGDIILGGFNLRDGVTLPNDAMSVPNLLRVDGTTGAQQRDISPLTTGGVTRAVLLTDGSVLAFTDAEVAVRVDVDPAAGGPIAPEFPLLNGGAQVRSLVPDGTDAFIIAGGFSSVARTSRSNLARIAITGLGEGQTPALTLDPTFTTPANNAVWSIVRRRDDSLAIAGSFTQVDGRRAPLTPAGRAHGGRVRSGVGAPGRVWAWASPQIRDRALPPADQGTPLPPRGATLGRDRTGPAPQQRRGQSDCYGPDPGPCPTHDFPDPSFGEVSGAQSARTSPSRQYHWCQKVRIGVLPWYARGATSCAECAECGRKAPRKALLTPLSVPRAPSHDTSGTPSSRRRGRSARHARAPRRTPPPPHSRQSTGLSACWRR